MSDLDGIVQKLIKDPTFAAELIGKPEATLSAHGVNATPEMVAALKGLDAAAVQKLASAFGNQKAAAA